MAINKLLMKTYILCSGNVPVGFSGNFSWAQSECGVRSRERRGQRGRCFLKHLQIAAGRSPCCHAPGWGCCTSPTSEKNKPQRFEFPECLKCTDIAQPEKNHGRLRRLSWRKAWGVPKGRTWWSKSNRRNAIRRPPHPQLLPTLLAG